MEHRLVCRIFVRNDHEYMFRIVLAAYQVCTSYKLYKKAVCLTSWKFPSHTRTECHLPRGLHHQLKFADIDLSLKCNYIILLLCVYEQECLSPLRSYDLRRRLVFYVGLHQRHFYMMICLTGWTTR